MDLHCRLMDHAVLQRNAEGVSDHELAGSCRTSGSVWLTVRKNGAVVPGFDRLPAGTAARGKVDAAIRGLPTGGPYQVKLEIGDGKESALFDDILVGDLWLLAGQSGMADSGERPSRCGTDELVRGFFMDNRWDIARDPLHVVCRAAAPVHGGDPANPLPKFRRGAGPGLPFGITMRKMTGVPQGLIACAHGGTSLSQWDPALRKLGGRSFYGAMYERLKMLGGKVAGLIWYQGENETAAEETSAAYEKNTAKIFAAVRRDCGDPGLPVVFVQLGASIPLPTDREAHRRWLMIRDTQYRMGQKMKNTVCVPAIDLGLCDSIHLSARHLLTLGGRIAQAMLSLTGKGAPQIAVGAVSCANCEAVMCARVTVRFRNVQGSLRADGRPCGFSVVDREGNFVSEAVNVTLDGDRALVQTRHAYSGFPGRYRIAYGGEMNPHANITDEAGRSLPCFMKDIPPRRTVSTGMLSKALVSEAIYGREKAADLNLPEDGKVTYHPAKFSEFYLPCPRETPENNTRSKVYCYKFRMEAEETMKVRLLFGADAAFLLCCDGREVMRERAINPVIQDEFRTTLTLEAGRHDFVCVFSSNSGNGWGICCRAERIGGKIPPRFVDPA